MKKLPCICTLSLTPDEYESAVANGLDLTKIKDYHLATGYRLRENEHGFTGREISMKCIDGKTKVIAVFKRA